MLRIVLAALLSLLLLALQHESLVHEFQHDRARLADSRVALHSAAHGTCTVCALVAGGAHGIAGIAPTSSAAGPAHVAPRAATSRVRAAFVRYYSSRAPPVPA